MLLQALLISLIAQIPVIAVAIVFSIVGWRRLRVHHRNAAAWLIAGMATFSARWIIGGLSAVYINFNRAQIQVAGGELSEIAPMLAVFNVVLALVLILSLACLGMAAISGRPDPIPAVAPSNPSLERP